MNNYEIEKKIIHNHIEIDDDETLITIKSIVNSLDNLSRIYDKKYLKNVYSKKYKIKETKNLIQTLNFIHSHIEFYSELYKIALVDLD